MLFAIPILNISFPLIIDCLEFLMCVDAVKELSLGDKEEAEWEEEEEDYSDEDEDYEWENTSGG